MIADFIFIADLVVTSFSAYYSEDDLTLVTNNRKIFTNYLKGWFVIDVVASIPVSFFEDELRISS